MKPPRTKTWRILRHCLVGMAICLVLIGLFYAEEDWRGERAWKNCKLALQAQGAKLDWADFIPAQVPEEDNVFGVPEMQKWFGVGRDGPLSGWEATDLSKKLTYPGWEESNRTARLVVAKLTICPPGASFPSNSGSVVLSWGEPRARAEVERLIKAALGPVVWNPRDFNYMLRLGDGIRPAQIFLQCQTAPDTNALLEFLPKTIAEDDDPDAENIQIEPDGSGSYAVTILAPDTVSKFLDWNEQLEPDFALMRQALLRP